MHNHRRTELTSEHADAASATLAPFEGSDTSMASGPELRLAGWNHWWSRGLTFQAQIPNLWGGSTLKVGGFITTYTVSGSKGVSLQLTKVQVINPVSGGGDQDGFDSIDGGFVAQEITQEAFDDGVEQEVVHEAKADRFWERL